MIIVRNIEGVINRYLDEVNNGRLRKLKCCKVCGKECNLWWHDEYIRKLITLCGIYEIPIKRLYCPFCKQAFALIPGFIKKFHRYARDVIDFALDKLKKFSRDKVADKFMDRYSLYVSTLTLYNWKKKFCLA